jgi:EAL domain-containing protein (putative c-di-GMP-specific phosphodiesterase class I)
LKYDINPRSIKLEITESMMMENVEDAIKMLQQLRGLGIELSMDDFGTGYSSLNYLRRFPISTLKIDRSFVSQMGGGEENAEIVKTIVMLAKNLNMDVIAEGIETEKQRLQLMALRCQYGQGYLFSRPLSPVDAALLLKDNRSFNLDMREMSLPDDVVEHTSRFVA